MTGGGGGDRPVVVVTGGGGGIGAAVAAELGRRGTHVVTVDPLVSVDGTEQLPAADETTAGRILAAGGSAEASNASVTDGDAVAELFDRLATERGRIDGVVNVAGITRPTGFAKGTAEDWAAVLSVHLDGYVNVLTAALPHLAAAGGGSIVGVTSGSGWRAADAGAYSAAKRAVASLTWQLGRVAPEGAAVNAISPIAMTRMVAAALGRIGGGGAATPGGSAKTGGLSLAGMPAPEDLAPLAAHLASEGAGGLRGQILFAGGSEVATIEPPALLEVLRTAGAGSLGAVLDAALRAFAAAEAAQATTGGANPRFEELFESTAWEAGRADAHVLVAADRAELGAAVAAHLAAQGATVETATTGAPPADLARFDGIVLAADEPVTEGGAAAWEAVLRQHVGLADRLRADAAWALAASSTAADDRPLRLVTVTDARSAGGRSRAQAIAQLARASRKASGDRVPAFSVGLEDPSEVEAAAALAARLATSADLALSGAELAVGPGWIGLRSHPHPGTSLVYGGPELPGWFDDVLGEATR